MKAGFVTRKELQKRWPGVNDGDLLEIILGGSPGCLDYTSVPGASGHYTFRAWHPSYEPIYEAGALSRIAPAREGQVPPVVRLLRDIFPYLGDCYFRLDEIEAVKGLCSGVRGLQGTRRHRL